MQDDLTNRLEEFRSCVVDRNTELAQRVLDDEFTLVLVVPQPAVMPRARWLEVLPDYLVDEWDVEHVEVHQDGDVAAVLQRVRMRATVLGEDRSGTFVISDIWRRRADGWRVWRRHSTPLAAGAMPGVSAGADQESG
ncbi:MAG TPA: nuclear transport factor 2 family protein [Mycobacteriales bacterium]|nr:nuclear transport factor 2 family protein [Mycobacteriales bacterium]